MRRNPSLDTLASTGFRFHEVMAGKHEFVARHGPAGEFPFSFELDWGSDSLADFLNPIHKQDFLLAVSEGVIRVGELVDRARCKGSLELNYFSEAKIRYRLTFAAQGRRFEYIGEKLGIRPWNLHRSHTICYGVIYDLEKGHEVSRSITRFDLKSLPGFLSSFHLKRH